MPDISPPTIRILYQDDHVIAVSKPSGLLVHRSKEARDTVFLLQTLSAQIGRLLYPVHRIDRAASGIVIFALSSDDARELQTAMTSTSATKEYFVLVRGEAPPEGSSDRALTDDRGVKREAHSSFVRERLLDRCSLLRVKIRTGRRHQIRRHLSHMRHQVIGDTTYGKGGINRVFREQYGLHRLFLHACRLSLPEGPWGQGLEILDALPEELEAVLGRVALPAGQNSPTDGGDRPISDTILPSRLPIE